MAFCAKCGTPLETDSKFCPNCGDMVAQQQPQQTPPTAESIPDKTDAAQNRAMAVLAYIGILFLIPLLAAKTSPFARYHTNQGIVLFLASLIYSVATRIVVTITMFANHLLGGLLSGLFGLGSILFLVLMILGIVNAAQGKQKPLPVIGEITVLK